MDRFIAGLALLLMLVLAPVVYAQSGATLPPGTTIRAVVDLDTVVVGDTIKYRFDLLGNVKEQQIDPPSFVGIKGLELQDGPTALTPAFSYDGGKSTMTRSWQITLKATAEGKFVIPSARLLIMGNWFETNPVNVVVKDVPVVADALKQAISARTNSPDINKQLANKYFALAEVPETIYQGQVVPVSVYVYRSPSLVSFRQWEKVREASGKDFVIPSIMDDGTIPQGPRWEKVTVGGEEFLRALIFTSHVVPTRSGPTRLTPPYVRIYLQPEQRAPRRIDDIMFGPSLIPADLEIRQLALDVKPVPDRPASAAAQIIGNVVVDVKADRVELPQRELLTLTFAFAGEGFLDMLSAPELPELPGLIALDKSVKSRSSIKNNQFLSQKNFDFVFQAARPGTVEIPSFEFSVFNPKTARQEVVKSAPITITVAPTSSDAVLLGGATPAVSPQADPTMPKAEAKVLGSDVAYIDTAPLLSTALTAHQAFYLKPWFWIIQLVPTSLAFAWGFAAIWKRNAPAETTQMVMSRTRKQAAKAVQQARLQLEKSNRDEFYATLSEGILTYVATIIGRSARGLTSQEAADKLMELGRDADTCGRLRAMLNHCDAIRYSPSPDTPETRREALTNAEDLLTRLGEQGVKS